MKRLIMLVFIILSSFQFISCYQSDIWDITTDKKDETAPALISATAINNTQVEVVFSEEVDQQSAEITGNYTITGSTGFTVTSAVRNSADFARVTLATSSQLNVTYTLTVANVKDKFENVIGTSNTTSFAGDALPAISSVVANNNTQIQVVFTEPLFGSGYYRIYNSSMIEIYNLNLTFNSAISATLTTPSQNNSVYYISIDGFYDTNGNYAETTDTYSFNGDALPYLISVSAPNTLTVQVVFSEAVDSVSADILSNYIITGGSAVTIDSANRLSSPNDNIVNLTISSLTPLSSIFSPYTLTVINVIDIDGNNLIGTPNIMGFSYP